MKNEREELKMCDRVRRQNHALCLRTKSRMAVFVMALAAIILALTLSKNESVSVNAHSDKDLYYCSVQVQEGDTIWSIAREHMTEDWMSTQEYVKAIKKLNRKKTDYIYAGMYLSIPYYR